MSEFTMVAPKCVKAAGTRTLRPFAAYCLLVRGASVLRFALL